VNFKFKTPSSLLGRIALWGLPVLLILFIGGFLYLRSWLNNYLQSDDFRQLLGRITSKQLNARCEYEPFHFSGLTINAEAFKAQGTQKAAFSTLELDKIRTTINLSGLWNKALQIDEVSIDRLQVSVGHTGAPPVPESEIGVEPTQEKTPASSKTSWLSPKLDLRKVIVHDTNVLWGEKTTQAGSVTNTEVTGTPDGDAWNVLLKGGTISQKGGPDLKLDHIKVHYAAPVVSFTDGLLVFPPGGNIGLSGDVDTERKLDVQVRINSIPLKPFLPPSAQSELQGDVFADIKVTGPIPVETPPEVSGSGHLQDGYIEGIPALDSIAKFTRSPQFRKIKLDTASADFDYAGQKVTVTNLLIESKGLVSVTGGFVINNSRINGTFEIGIPHDYLKWLPFLEAKVFTREHAGYRWAPMHVSGPLSSPQEDLLHRVEMALPAEALDAVTGVVKDLPKVPDVPKKALDGLFKQIHK
jgi:hypothetical protein